MTARPTDEREEGEFPLLLGCPACGGEVALSTFDRAARCPFCDVPHLVFGRDPATPVTLPNRIHGDDDLLAAILEDWARRRWVERSLALPGGNPERLDPLGEEGSRLAHAALDEMLPGTLAPGSGLPEAVLTAEVAAETSRLLRETRLVSSTAFHAPYWHLAGRVWDTAIGRAPDGFKRAAAAVRGLELSRNAFDDDLPVPGMGSLAGLPGIRPLGAARTADFPHLAISRPSGALDDAITRALSARPSLAGLTVIGRRRTFWPGESHLVFRPFSVAEIEGPGGRRRLLVDGAARSVVGLLGDEEDARLRRALRPRLEAGTPGSAGARLGLRPMRCPDCAGPLPLDRRGEIRFCTTCGRAIRVIGDRLETVPHLLEPPPERGTPIWLPFWRFDFRLADPRDGQVVDSIAKLRERIGGRPTIRADRSRKGDRLDVPAFRPLDRRRATEVFQFLFAAGRAPAKELLVGPGRVEAGFATPARFVALQEAEAASVARAALLLRLSEQDLTNASPVRIESLLFEGRLELTTPQLVLRAFRVGDVAPISDPLGLGR